jgi:hypothetical protein
LTKDDHIAFPIAAAYVGMSAGAKDDAVGH